jgi:hypothetical protein
MNKLQPNELRVGNLVTDEFYPDFERIITVESIGEKGINLSASDDNAPYGMHNGIIEYDMLFESLRGIPLSEEWLIKLGAETVGEFKIFESFLIELGRNRRLSISVQPGNQYIWIQEYTKEDRTIVNDLVCLFNGDHDGTLYVHTLQNIFHAIRGTELKVTEF